jgi:predicted AlkP superfamily pyrophosphatase or phosphodiesterase
MMAASQRLRRIFPMSRFRVLFTTALVALSAGNAVFADSSSESRVTLVLQITIDGLRADLLNRYGDRFAEGGFRYLLDKGVVYANAHYQHANTETIVGHTTLATGAFPSEHGMIGNVWFDREAGELAYNIEDPESPIIPTRDTETKGEQVDPAQKLSRTQGRSPVTILAATLSDGLAAFYGGRSKIFAVSGKDRGAVPMAGHAGKAFWFSTDTGDFVTSTYYYDAYPDWVRDWNAQRNAESYAGSSWTLLNGAATYLLGHQDDRAYEVDLKGYGRVFPHPYGEQDDKLLYTRLLASPVGDQLVLDFSKALVRHEQLGRDAFPDYLSISFSSLDAVNHFFGPSSLENEDVIVQLDRTLADLFAFIEKTVGLKNTLIVLSADHGMAEMPEYMTELGYAASRHDPDNIV